MTERLESAHRTALAVVWCALSLVPTAVAGQVAIFPVQDLAFGQLQPGVTNIILTTDAARRAQFEFMGKGAFIATFVLPAEMTPLAGGDPLPLTIGPGDAVGGQVNNPLPFDPTQPYSFRGHPNKPEVFYLGGTAIPSLIQSPGGYTATITVIITQAGA